MRESLKELRARSGGAIADVGDFFAARRADTLPTSRPFAGSAPKRGIPPQPQPPFAVFAACTQYAALAMAMVLIAMALSSCGFQLRGQVAVPFQTLFVEAPGYGYSAFVNDLERAIRSGSATRIVSNRGEAEAVLKIIAEVQEKQILSLSSAGRVREFELRYRVAYRLTDKSSVDLAPPGEISLRRDMTYDDTQVLAKESEEALLYRDMKADAVQQMLRRLSVVHRSS